MLKKESNWKKLAIILVNYNGRDIIGDCIDSILAQSFKDFEILVLDNGSADNSMEIVEKYESVHTVYLNNNTGWAGGNNEGMRIAFSHGSEYVLLLNTDTEVEAETINGLLRSCNETQVSVPRIYKDKSDKDNSLWYAGGRVDLKTADVEQVLYPYDSEDSSANEVKKVSFATGCCLMISKAVWEKTGEFDEEYFLYYEDTDYCMRLMQNGIDIIYVPSVGLWHKVGGSSGGEVSYVSQYYTVRNRLFFAQRFSEYMESSLMDVLHEILKMRTYFTSSYDRKYKRFVSAAIKDFLEGVRGKEKNLIHDKFTVLEGFYDCEENDGKQWLWNGDKTAVIEVDNPFNETKVVEFYCNIVVNEGMSSQKVKVFWNDEYRCTVTAPQLNFCISEKLEAGKKAAVKFVVDVIDSDDEHLRPLAYALENIKILYQEYKGYFFLNGTRGTECENDETFYWVGDKEAYLRIDNDSRREQLYDLRMSFYPAKEGKKLSTVVDCNDNITPIEHLGEYQFYLNIPAKSNSKIGLLSQRAIDDLYCQIRNINLNPIKVVRRKLNQAFVLNDFYDITYMGGRYAQPCCEYDTYIEMVNTGESTRLFTFQCNFEMADAGENIELDVYWDDEKIDTVTLPRIDYCIQRPISGKSSARIKFVDRKSNDTDYKRPFLFMLGAIRSYNEEYHGYALVKGSYGAESAGDRKFYWISEDNAMLEIYNDSESVCLRQFLLSFYPAPGNDMVHGTLRAEDGTMVDIDHLGEHNLVLKMQPHEIQKVMISVDKNQTKGWVGSSRPLFCQVSDIKVALF